MRAKEVVFFQYQNTDPIEDLDSVEDKMCSGNERKEIKPSTSNKGDSQADGEDNGTHAMPKNS